MITFKAVSAPQNSTSNCWRAHFMKSWRGPPPKAPLDWLPDQEGLHIPGDKSLCKSPTCSFSQDIPSDGLPNPTKGSLVPNFLRTPWRRVSPLREERQHREDQGQRLPCFKVCALLLSERETSQSHQQKPGRVCLSLAGMGHHQSVLIWRWAEPRWWI